MFKFGRKKPAPAPEPKPTLGWTPQPVECLSESLRALIERPVERPVEPLPMSSGMGGNWDVRDLHPDDRRAVYAEDRAAGRLGW